MIRRAILPVLLLLLGCSDGGGGFQSPTDPENAHIEFSLEGLIETSGPLFVSVGQTQPPVDVPEPCVASQSFDIDHWRAGTDFFEPPFRSTEPGTATTVSPDFWLVSLDEPSDGRDAVQATVKLVEWSPSRIEFDLVDTLLCATIATEEPLTDCEQGPDGHVVIEAHDTFAEWAFYTSTRSGWVDATTGESICSGGGIDPAAPEWPTSDVDTGAP